MFCVRNWRINLLYTGSTSLTKKSFCVQESDCSVLLALFNWYAQTLTLQDYVQQKVYGYHVSPH